MSLVEVVALDDVGLVSVRERVLAGGLVGLAGHAAGGGQGLAYKCQQAESRKGRNEIAPHRGLRGKRENVSTGTTGERTIQ
jgi:hypothetical protein